MTVFQTFRAFASRRARSCRHSALRCCSRYAQGFSHFQGRVFGTNEDNRRIKIFRFRETHQRLFLRMPYTDQ